MKHLKALLLLPITLSVGLTGCSETYKKINEIYEGSKIFEVNYDKVDYDYGDKFWKDNNDNWGGGCTAVTKELSNGHRVVGRNMDLNISDKAAYVVRTAATEDTYKTLGLAYTYRDYAPLYNEVKERGISEHFRKILPFLCDDVMNDQGLHIEVNMRHAETDFAGNDQFSLKETNPGKRRVHMFELPRYIGAHCKTVAEAKEYIKTLDIYSKQNYWNYAFIISDSANGVTHSALLEFSEIGQLGYLRNELIDSGQIKGEKVYAVNWFDDTKDTLTSLNYLGIGPARKDACYKVNALAQANFYVNEWAYCRQDMKSGQGRFFAIQSLIKNVDTTDQMYDLMRRISYSWFYGDFDECMKKHFDPRSENLGEFQGATYNFLFDERWQGLIRDLFNAFNKRIRNMTREEKVKDGTIWESTFTEVVDVTAQTIEVRFFENEDLRFNISFEGNTKLEAKPTITDWSDLPAPTPINS